MERIEGLLASVDDLESRLKSLKDADVVEASQYRTVIEAVQALNKEALNPSLPPPLPFPILYRSFPLVLIKGGGCEFSS